MNRFEFGELIYDNVGIYIIVFLCTTWLYYIVFKPFFISLLDPFIITQFFSLFATVSVLFLGIIGVVDIDCLLQFSFTQLAFWIGLYSFKPKVLNNNVEKLTEIKRVLFLNHRISKQTIGLYIYFSIIFILLQLFVYVKFGIPLFLASRLSLFEGSGGWGILGRILGTLNVIVFVGSCYVRLFYSNIRFLRFYSVFVVLFVLVTYILSGSKSTFIGLLNLYFLFLLLYDQSKIKKIRKYELSLLLSIAIGALGIIMIQNGAESPLVLLFDRIVGSGDTFYQGYFPNNIMQIKGNAFTLLFADILGSYRIVDWASLPRPIGMQLYSLIYNVDLDMGGNARHNFLGLICFGYLGSFLFSYIIGWLVSYIRNKLYSKFYFKGFLLGSFYVLLLQGVIVSETDFTMFVSQLNSLFITYFFLFLLFLLWVGISFLVGKCELIFSK